MEFTAAKLKPASWADLSCPCCFRPGAPLCEDFSPADNALKVKGMRSLLKAHGLAAFIVASGDAHSSEYVSDADKRREWLTGFTGSAGTALASPRAVAFARADAGSIGAACRYGPFALCIDDRGGRRLDARVGP